MVSHNRPEQNRTRLLDTIFRSLQKLVICLNKLSFAYKQGVSSLLPSHAVKFSMLFDVSDQIFLDSGCGRPDQLVPTPFPCIIKVNVGVVDPRWKRRINDYAICIF